MGLSKNMQALLLTPERELKVQVALERDNGEIATYVGFPGSTAGAVSSSVHTDFQGGDAVLRRRILGGDGFQVAALGGYRFLHLGDTLNNVFFVNSLGFAPANTPSTQGEDSYRTRNRFHGADLGLAAGDQAFEIPAKEARSFSWRIVVPDGQGPVTYKAVGAAEKFSDGEEGMIPVLSKRVLVTESLPLPIRGMQSKTFNRDATTRPGTSSRMRPMTSRASRVRFSRLPP